MNTFIQLLIIDDSESDSDLIVRELARSEFNIKSHRVDTGDDLRAALQGSDWDVIISDFNIPGFGAGEALKILHELGKDIPFILVSGQIGEEDAVSIMKSGAHDYVMKDKLARLPLAVKRELKDAAVRSERNNALERLRESSVLMRQAQKLANLGNWFWDMRTNSITWSDELYSIYGIERSAFKATFESYLALIHPEDRKRVEDLIINALKSKESVEFEERIVRPSGEVRILKSWGAVRTNEYGMPIKMYGACLDITESKKVLETLQNNELKFRSLVENIGDIISLLDVNGTVLYESDSIKNVLGYNATELVGQNIFMYVHPDDIRHVTSAFSGALINSGVAAPVQFRIKMKNGEYKFVESQGNNQLNNSAIRAVIVTTRDISDRKKVEEAIRQKNLELEKTNNEIDQFVYSTSHDLRAPLLSVLGLIDLCEDTGQNNPELAHLYEMMRTSINRIDQVIKSIIDYSRNARIDSVIEEVQVKPVIESLIENVKHISGSQGINFEVEVVNPIPFVGDRLRLTTIVNNLLSNAIKFQREEEKNKKVVIRFINGGPLSTLEVEDNGEGIPPEKLNEVFKMFFRYSTKSVGSGLGLYICKEMVEKLNGKMTVSSTLGKGTVFKVILPNAYANNKLKNEEDTAN